MISYVFDFLQSKMSLPLLVTNEDVFFYFVKEALNNVDLYFMSRCSKQFWNITECYRHSKRQNIKLYSCFGCCGNIKQIVWTLEYMKFDTMELIIGALVGGRLDILEWMRFQNFIDKPAMGINYKFIISHCGGLKSLEWFYSHYGAYQNLWDASTVSEAAEFGELDILKWLRKDKTGQTTLFPLSNNSICPWDETACAKACIENDYNNNIEMLKWLRSQNPPCPWNGDVYSQAIVSNRLDILQWARSQNPPCPWSSRCCFWAVRKRRFNMLKWLRSQNPPCPWGVSVCREAASIGDLSTLKWLRCQDPPCPWNATTFTSAVSYVTKLGNENLELLEWLKSSNCPWGASACLEASTNGSIKVLEWLRSQDPPCPWDEAECCVLVFNASLNSKKRKRV